MTRIPLLLVLVTGCTADLLPGEKVLGDEIPAVIITGEPDSELGAAVAVGDDALAVGAPGQGMVAVYGLDGRLGWSVTLGRQGGRRVWWQDDEVVAWQRGVGIWRLGDADAAFDRPMQVEALPEATSVAPCPDGTVATVDGVAETVACSDSGIVRTRCDGVSCDVLVNDEVVAHTSPGSAVSWDGDVACWGDMGQAMQPDSGSVHCADGRAVEGRVGDHLGASLAPLPGGGLLAAGVFNDWQVPAVARVVPIDGGEVWVTDRAAERSRLAVHAHGGRVAVGVPGYQGTQPLEGRVFLVEGQP